MFFYPRIPTGECFLWGLFQGAGRVTQRRLHLPASSVPLLLPILQQKAVLPGTFFSSLVLMSIYFQTEREHVHMRRRGPERERERERIPNRLHTVSTEPDCGARSHKPRDHDLSQNQELVAQLTDPARLPSNSLPGLEVSARKWGRAQKGHSRGQG